ncbi:putative MPP superfamily phosphohydrolase [Amnibacterium kyonggiense]|uniref:Putative MPP superfamily phosphohydrolase n=1 Tax=Amnibacterium kyonggiense TaxID=595671 RepID=A0A4R7FFR9_9MICO|nr:putative MPP superfamily phosphohydrolase [Amnibacterium kyonggiense]
MWGVGVERLAFTVRRATLPVLAPGTADLKVLHLSDLHMAPWQRRKQRFVRELADLEPDLVVNTGDNLGHRMGLLGIKAAFEPFRGVPGLYVWGSNDWWAPQPKNPFAYFGGPSGVPTEPERLATDALGSYLEGLGWTSLNNRTARLVVRGTPIDAFGTDDPHREYDDLAALNPGLRGLRQRKVRPALSLGVTHAPYRRILDAFVDRGADLLLAGHTHGGQVCVPGFGALVTNCDIPREQVKGVSSWEHDGRTAALEVSAGLGTSIYAPVRFACRPEATLLTLTARPA